jgi:protein CpxP
METRKARKDSNVKPTAEEKAALKKEMMDEKTATETQMKSILNADQYKKWIAMREENKEKMKEKMNDKKNKQ